MADTFEKILFEAGFDAAEFTRGIDGMVAALKRAQEQERQLVKEINLTAASLEDTDDNIKKVTITIAGLDKNSKDYSATNIQLNTKLADLNKQHDKYTASLISQNKQLDVVRGTIAKMETAYQSAATAVNDLQAATGKTVAPSLNDGKLTEQISNIREKLEGAFQIIPKLEVQPPASIPTIETAIKINTDSVNEQLNVLSQKAEDLRDQLSKTTDVPAKSALQTQLDDVLQKMQAIEAENNNFKANISNTGGALSKEFIEASNSVERLKENLNIALDPKNQQAALERRLDAASPLFKKDQTIADIKAAIARDIDERVQALRFAEEKLATTTSKLATTAPPPILPAQIQPSNVADEVPQIEKTVQAYTRLRQVRNELAKERVVIPPGGFKSAEEEAIAFQTAITNTNKELSLAGRNTAGITALKETFRGVVGVAEAAAGAMALFGGNTEDTEKAMKITIGTMGILNGIEEVTALLSKNSAVNFYLEGLAHKSVAKATEEEVAALALLNEQKAVALAETNGIALAEARQVIATEAATVAQEGLNVAMKANPLALIVIGLLGLFGLYETYIHTIGRATEAEKKLERETELTNEALKASAHSVAEASTQVDILKVKFDLAKDGLLSKNDVLKEYNETLGKTLGVTNSFNEAEQTTIDNSEQYIKIIGLKAKAQALANIRIKESEKVITADLEDNRNIITKAANFLFTQLDEQDKRAEEDKKRFATNIKKESNEKIEFVSEEEIRVQKEIADATLPFKDKPKDLSALKTGKEKERKDITNIYEQELEKLRADIAKLDEKGFTDEATITRAVEADFKKRQSAFDKAFKKGQITAPQLSSLTENLNKLQTLTVTKEIKEFTDLRIQYLTKIDDELTTLQNEVDIKRISNLQDNFQRERLTIIEETEKTVVAVQQKRDKEIADLQKNAPKRGITDAELQVQISVITNTYSDLLDTIEAIKNQKLQKLSFDTFEKLSEDARRVLDAGNLGISQGSLVNIKEQTSLFLAGKISYEKYQKELTDIARLEANERFSIEKTFLESEIRIREAKLKNDKTLTDDQITKLKDEITALKQQLSDAEKSNVTGQADNKNTEGKQRLDDIVNYASAIKSVTDSIISFWQSANDAEQKALERSISIQDRRVEAARNIAAKGNAEYLRMEEERQQQLLIKQENAARRTIAINAALQASQLLVAVTGAVAKIAQPGVGTVDVIASIGIIIGALASGYALVKSLQANQPSFYEGTEYVGGRRDATHNITYLERRHEPSGRDTIPAWLHEGESVNNVTTTNNYYPAIKAMHRKTIPPATLNYFVENWKTKPLPQLNMENMEMASNVSLTFPLKHTALLEDNNKKLDENIALQKQTIKVLRGMGVSVNFDKHGVAVSVLETAAEMLRNKKM